MEALIRFDFRNLHRDGGPLQEPHDIMLRVVSDFSIIAGNQVVYEEVHARPKWADMCMSTTFPSHYYLRAGSFP
jgi:hypothetical protein